MGWDGVWGEVEEMAMAAGSSGATRSQASRWSCRTEKRGRGANAKGDARERARRVWGEWTAEASDSRLFRLADQGQGKGIQDVAASGLARFA